MSLAVSESPSAAVRARLSHPIIDGDSHVHEYLPVFLEYLERVAGKEMVERFNNRTLSRGSVGNWYSMTPEERRHLRPTRGSWWTSPTRNTLDRATAMLPRLLAERMDELGLDFVVLYPTLGLTIAEIVDGELRQASCRAYNTYVSEYYREFADRMTITSVIPMHTPDEAIAEMEHAKQLGLKVALIPSFIRRPVPWIAEKHPDIAYDATWPDSFGIDSDYDYDPVWAKALELGLPLGVHTDTQGLSERRSISMYMHNHIGMFAAGGEMFCKSLFFGGVTRRFPQLRFAVLEGGVAVGSRVYADLVSRWEKRNAVAVENMNPDNMDRELAFELFERYGGPLAGRDREEMSAALRLRAPEVPPEYRDDFRNCGITRAEDVADLWVQNFYFGCEADDPMNAIAFDRRMNPFGVQIKAILGTDLGHWDVTNMRETVAEAYEMVEHGLMTEDDFRKFAFSNQVELYAGTNHDFFNGTRVEVEASKVLAEA